MSNRIKGIKIRYANGEVSDEFPIGALAQNVDYNQLIDVKQKIDNINEKIDTINFADRIKKGSTESSFIINDIAENQASGPYTLTEGYHNQATAQSSHAEGMYTLASGQASHTEGQHNQATAQGSHAEGMYTLASGQASHSEGSWTKATGISSHAEGYGSQASGFQSHTEGNYTIASGSFSHAEGQYTIANHRNQHVFGAYNIKDPHTAAATSHGSYIEIVGNGTDNNNKSNARTLDWDGNQWLAGNLKIGGISYNDEEAEDVATKIYVDRVTSQISESVATKIYVDDAIAQIPKIPKDVATKAYVDNAVSQIPVISKVNNAIIEINGTGMDIITTSSELTDTILTLVGTEIHITVAS